MSMSTGTSTQAQARAVSLREVQPEDVADCARICFEAFGGIHDQHRFPRDFPALEKAVGLIEAFVGHPAFWGVVAEVDGRIAGSNFLDERGPVRGLGPITVDPGVQNVGVGRRLMEAAIERGEGAPSIRLLQDGFHMRSLVLYTSLGFDVTEPVVLMSGTPAGEPTTEPEVRPFEEDDLEACNELSRRVHGFDRSQELGEARQRMAPYVAVRDGRVTAYATAITMWPMAHGVAETEEDMHALILGAAAGSSDPVSFICPIRRSGLWRWSLEQGLRAIKPMNVMVRGEYAQPAGCWFPSVLY
jgi:predicted N-acetyltransferase YhbS